MSKWKYRKLGDSHVREICVKCNRNLQKKRANGTYTPLCSQCDKKRWETKKRKARLGTRRGYRKYKGSVCEKCGFVPESPRQLDVHHLDNNHTNQDPNNLQTLCANCHRLEHS